MYHYSTDDWILARPSAVNSVAFERVWVVAVAWSHGDVPPWIVAPFLHVAVAVVAAPNDGNDVVVDCEPLCCTVADAVLPNWEAKVPKQPFLAVAAVAVLLLVQVVLLLLLLLEAEADEQFARDIPLPDIDQMRAHRKYKPKNRETASA